MATGQPKKLYIMQTLEVLQRYSDENHHLKQNDIIRHLKNDYDVECERKAVARNIASLETMGYEIAKDNGYYLQTRSFEDSELRLLIDSVLASRHIPLTQSKDLIDKLVNQSSIYFKKQMRHIHNLDRLPHAKKSQLFYNIDVLSEAIEKKRKVSFYYNKKDINFESKHTSAKPHVVNPYQIVVANGRYYLIGNIDKYNNVTHFRVEKISDIKLREDVVKDVKTLEGLKNGLNLPEHIVEHIYMFSGKSERITLKVKTSSIDDVIDWLGENIRITPTQDSNYVMVEVRANASAMKYWSIQFGESVELISPEYLRAEVKESLKEIMSKYE